MQVIRIENSVLLTNILLIGFSFLMLFLILLMTEDSIGSKKQIIHFRLMLAGLMTSMVCAVISNFILYISLPMPNGLFHILAIGMYLPVTISFMEWLSFVAETTRLTWISQRIWKTVIHLPVLLMLIIMLTPFYQTVLLVRPDHTMVAGAGEIMAIVVNSLYLVIALFMILLGRKSMRRKSERKINIALAFHIICVIVGEILAVVFPLLPTFELFVIPGCFLIYSELVMSQSYSDALTGLNNRRRIDDFLENALVNTSPEHSTEVYLIDLDCFKSINDILGHNEGDRALCVFSDALKRGLGGKGNLLGRYGGDEFVAIMIGGDRDPESVRNRLRKKLDEVCRENDIDYTIMFSVGYSVATTPGITKTEMLKRADEEMYRIKDDHHKEREKFIESLRRAKIT